MEKSRMAFGFSSAMTRCRRRMAAGWSNLPSIRKTASSEAAFLI